ncbi:MAG: double-strand break repair helicase AddA [Pseudomonadota bacterium]
MTDATSLQRRAADPGASSWVAANAGSGKTRVLTDRVARLLLRGTAPDRILCLTYTKAAAAEMQTRLFRRLGDWAMMSDEALRAALADLGERTAAITDADLTRARTLFARALEAPGGLKIQTIHAFCDRLLRRFPLEAGVPPLFSVLDAEGTLELRRRLLDDIAEEDPSFARLAIALTASDPMPLLEAIERRRDDFWDPDTLDQRLAAWNRDASAERQDVVGALDPEGRSALQRIMTGSTSQRERRLAAALAAPTTDALLDVLLKKDGTPVTHNFPVKATRDAHADVIDLIDTLQRAAVSALDARRLAPVLDQTRLLHAFAQRYLARLNAAKAARGVLDFDDLIIRTQHLLRDAEAAAWVQYRLDGGIDHVLVDEAQDTSPAQWRVVSALTEEFFAGLSARETVRTVFVVGDIKQSIYSFQGADPRAFDEMRARYSAVLDAALIGLEECELLYSFRSAPPILKVVDAVFAPGGPHGLATPITHRAFHVDKPGRVELWPWIHPPDKPEDPPWDAPVDMPSPDAPRQKLAERIASWAEALLTSGRALPGTGRRVRASDILILVRARGEVFNAVIAALKRVGLDVAGADRLALKDDLAARDLLSLLRFLASEDDDLALAELLRSPLGGVSEGELFALAHGRSGTLWQRLRVSAEHSDLAKWLGALRDSADFERPYEILSRALGVYGGRQRLLARLGPEAAEGIDALLDRALAYERSDAPTLVGFLAWLDAGDAEIKREAGGEGGGIRVMTVHGAKGLEAPIVVLPDTGDPRLGSKRGPFLDLHGTLLARPPAAQTPACLEKAVAAEDARTRAEHWRLLYVALTRAESWLVIAGAGELKERPETEWYTAVRDALAPHGAMTEDGTLTLDARWDDAPAPAEPRASVAPAPPPLEPLPPPPVAPAVILPSAVGAHGSGGDAPESARRRGVWLHAALETEGRAEDALRALADPPPEVEIGALAAEASAVRAAPHLAWIWTMTGRSEVPVAGRVAALGDRPIRGRIDRVLVGSDIWAIDFKSSRAVPDRPEEISGAILAQMALYRAALAEIWTDRTVRTGIVWTAQTRFMEVPHALVTAAWALEAVDQTRPTP